MGVPSPGCRGPARSEGDARGGGLALGWVLDPQGWVEGLQRMSAQGWAQLSVLGPIACFREILGVPCCAMSPMDTGFRLGSSASHQAVPRKTLLCC